MEWRLGHLKLLPSALMPLMLKPQWVTVTLNGLGLDRDWTENKDSTPTIRTRPRQDWTENQGLDPDNKNSTRQDWTENNDSTPTRLDRE
jgi:hypothetical protein